MIPLFERRLQNWKNRQCTEVAECSHNMRWNATSCGQMPVQAITISRSNVTEINAANRTTTTPATQELTSVRSDGGKHKPNAAQSLNFFFNSMSFD